MPPSWIGLGLGGRSSVETLPQLVDPFGIGGEKRAPVPQQAIGVPQKTKPGVATEDSEVAVAEQDRFRFLGWLRAEL